MRKMTRKEFPAGLTPDDFKYRGRPANDQDDFGSDVGIADCACVNQFGEANNSKHYHGGVVQSTDGRWWCYFEWGRIKPGPSWAGSAWTKNSQDFQFYECDGEGDARKAFAKQMKSKNINRLMQQTIAGKLIWTAKKGKDGYLAVRLATREKGLPDASRIKDDSGLDKPKTKAAPKTKKARAAKPTRSFAPQVVALAQALVGGVQTYTRSLAAASGITPTMATIEEVRNDIIPAAMHRIKVVGSDIARQVVDNDLIALSKLVAALVPRPIPRTGQDATEAILSGGNILALQQDLDAFEAALRNEDFTPTTQTAGPDPDALLNAKLTWLDPRSDGAWVTQMFHGMNPGSHGNVRHLRVRNIFAVERPDRDKLFVDAVKRLARKRKGQSHGHVGASYQPRSRPDLSDVSDLARDANVFVGIHGTRAVNVSPILQSNLRLPKSLAGVHITGAAFGHGLYFASLVGKSAQYVGSSSSVYGSGGGVKGRGYFMFLCDVAGGKFYYPTSAWTLSDRIPGDGDSVFAHPSRIRTLQNDEHVVFDAAQQRIRYVVEIDL